MAIVSRMDVTKVLGRECCVRARKLPYAAVLKAGRGLSTAELILDGPRPRASLRGRKVNFNAQSGAGPSILAVAPNLQHARHSASFPLPDIVSVTSNSPSSIFCCFVAVFRREVRDAGRSHAS